VLANDYFFAGAPALSRLDGLLLLAMFALFLFYIYQQLKGAPPQALESSHSTFSNLKIWLMITFGFVGLVLGGKLLVDNSLRIATTLGVSQKIIGLTILAAGTSLPELATSVIAALKKNTDIAIGNIIGSNIFNIFLILSASALVRPIAYNRAFNTDLYLLAGGTLFLFTAMFMGKNRKLDRWEAGILLAAYLVYTAYLISKEL
jgi:cation:H+ antiporter